MKKWNKYFFVLVLLVGLLCIQIPGHSQEENPLPGNALTDVDIRVYPNPSDGNFHVEIRTERKVPITAEIYDMTGKLVSDLSDRMEQEEMKLKADIHLEDDPPGIYFLRVESGKATVTRKIVIR
jgi:hypothetical protein